MKDGATDDVDGLFRSNVMSAYVLHVTASQLGFHSSSTFDIDDSNSACFSVELHAFVRIKVDEHSSYPYVYTFNEVCSSRCHSIVQFQVSLP